MTTAFRLHTFTTNEPLAVMYSGGRNHPLQSTSQKKYLEDYAVQHGFGNIQHFSDDGYSGTNFNRPAFNSLLTEIEAGRVGTVIVKDYCAIIGLNQKDLENQGILA